MRFFVGVRRARAHSALAAKRLEVIRRCRESNHLHAAQLAYERAYELLSKEPRSPELATLVKEMAELEVAMSTSPISSDPTVERE